MEVLDEVLASLTTGGGQAGQDLPSVFAGWRLVAAGEFSGDDGRAQGPLSPVVGGLDSGMV